MKELNGEPVQGREVTVNEARPQKKRTDGRTFSR